MSVISANYSSTSSFWLQKSMKLPQAFVEPCNFVLDFFSRSPHTVLDDTAIMASKGSAALHHFAGKLASRSSLTLRARSRFPFPISSSTRLMASMPDVTREAKERVTEQQRERFKKQFYSPQLPPRFDAARRILEQYSNIPAGQINDHVLKIVS